MNHDKYVVLKFLNIISDEFSKSQPDLIISKRFLHSDGTAQHFKQKYSLCTMTLMDGNIEWDFSATSHGKRDIDGLGSVVLVSREYVNKPLPAPLIHKTLLTLLNMLLLFAQQSPFFIAWKQMLKKLSNTWQFLAHWQSKNIYTIPGTQKAHYFRKVIPYMVGLQTRTSHASDFLLLKFTPCKADQPLEGMEL